MEKIDVGFNIQIEKITKKGLMGDLEDYKIINLEDKKSE